MRRRSSEKDICDTLMAFQSDLFISVLSLSLMIWSLGAQVATCQVRLPHVREVAV